MEKRNVIFTRKIAYDAFCYYKENPVNFSETAKFLNSKFSKKFNEHDIGRMFRHIVIFGKNDITAREIVDIVNSRANDKVPVYSKYLDYRRDYPKLLRRYNKMNELYFHEQKYHFMKQVTDDFISSEDESFIKQMNETLENSHNDYEQFDYEEFLSLKRQIKEIRKNEITSLY